MLWRVFPERLVRALAFCCLFLALFLLAHGVREMLQHDHMEHGAVVACVLVFTLLALLATPAPPPLSRLIASRGVADARQQVVLVLPNLRERASPASLQRYLT